ncbi:hypothetical protein [Lacrimispora sp. 38-1]|uniref:hypothetical protein n=1 Tax=Lacrimispora sp. 38-1 TaxID=3125778 RepID=UPI003CE80463
MKYLIKAGKLYQIDNGRPGVKLACLKTPYYPIKKAILSPDGRIKLYADIKSCQGGEMSGDRIYVLSDPLNQTILSGIPIYCDNLSLLSGMSVNQIRLTMEHRLYDLFMRSTREYCIMDENSWVAVRLEHCFEGGGWSVEADPVFSPFILMGFFIFCRYLDKENEFITD